MLNRSLNSRIFMISIGAAVAIIAITLSSIMQDRTRSLQWSENHSHNIARTMAEHTARSLDAVDLTLRSIKEQAERDRRSTPRSEQEIITGFENYIASFPQIRGLILTDKNGIIRYTERKKSMGMDVHDRGYFTNHKDNADLGLLIGKPLKGRTTGKWFFSTSRRILDNTGEFDGITMALVTQSYFAKVYEATEIEQNISLAYTSLDGTIFATSPGFSDDRSDVAGQIVNLEITNPDNGSFTGSPFSNAAPRIISYVKVPGTSIYMVSSIPVDTALASWHDRTLYLALQVGAALLVLAWLTFIASRHFNKREEAESKLSEIFHIAPEALIIINGDGTIQRFNEGAERIFGYEPHEIEGKHFDLLMPEGLRKAHEIYVHNFKASKQNHLNMDRRDDILGRRKDGTEFPAAVSVSKLDSKAQTIFTVILHDITDRRQAEEDLRNALVNAEQANQSKSEFLATMSHELRTPLNAILGFSDVLMNQYFGPPGAGKYKEYAKDIHSSGAHLLELVNDLLDISTIESGKKMLSKNDIDLAEIINDCAWTVSKSCKDKNINLTISIPDELLSVYADKMAIRQILLNLLSNSVKFTPNGGTISMSADTVENGVNIKTTDTGIGIDPKYLAELFNPYSRAESKPYTAVEGWGLGLSISKALVELHEGSITINSAPDKGTTIDIFIPQ
ncbi:MAG: PAS domain S-box protein [Rhodospirillales bacterium]|jgi:PAS domain S-box-containing protein|nr:PAS domain S-box protein [Rhodospirillales bacterium]